MADITTVVAGNITAAPELRYTQNGIAVVNFTIASTPRHFDKTSNEWKDGETVYLRAAVWREFAENVAGSLSKGDRVVATGTLTQRSYRDREGNERTAVELDVDDLGASLKRATASITRTGRTGSTPAPVAVDAGGSWGGSDSDDTPF